MANVAFGQYYPASSFTHKCDPRTKILFLIENSGAPDSACGLVADFFADASDIYRDYSMAVKVEKLKKL